MNNSSDFRQRPGPQNFATTQWSMVFAAGKSGPDSRKALEDLCKAYWYPLYRYVRSRGFQPDEAADLTQGFFTQLIERNDFESLSQEKGRFRSFLLASIRNFISNHRDRAMAKKRGGDVATFSIDSQSAENRFRHEPQVSQTPEISFEKSWALTILEHAQKKLELDYEGDGKANWYRKMRLYLGGEQVDLPAYRSLADELGISESAVKVNVHRMRKLFRKFLREEIAKTVASEAEVDDELNRMFSVLAH